MPEQEQYRVRVQGRGIPLAGDDIDTDRIIPARFMREVTFSTLGQYAFYDARFDEGGAKKDHPFNTARFEGANILIVNKNFGCGSSREHAPQSLMRKGINAFIGESFAEIFSGNCTALGLPAVRVTHADVTRLMAIVEADPLCRITIDLEQSIVDAAGEHCTFTMPLSDQKSLVSGAWDTLSVLRANQEAIRSTGARLPYGDNWKSVPG